MICTREQREKVNPQNQYGLCRSGSPTWTRTRDLRINSPSLYRLSYQGMKRCGHDTVRLSRRVREWTHRTFSRKRPTSVGNVSKVRMIVILA